MTFLHDRIAEATRLTRAGRLAEATRALQGLAPGAACARASGPGRDRSGVVLEGVAEAWAAPGGKRRAPAGSARPGAAKAAFADPAAPRPVRAAGPGAGAAPSAHAGSGSGARFLSGSFTLPPVAPGGAEAARAADRPTARPAGAGLAGLATALAQRVGRGPAGLSWQGLASRGVAAPGLALEGLALPGAAQAATRPYRLYVPASYDGRPAPLVVMLHGCTQSAEDFALGTRMNEAAEAQGCLVVWPEQVAAANASRCWRWFESSQQRRGEGEPALVAGITRQVMAEYAVDPARVYVAGLSAGGAAAAVLGARYPELYAAIGVHSGLACGAARDTASAFAAMRRSGPGQPGSGHGPTLPAIVFHGDSDSTVHPGNADSVIEQAKGGQAADGQAGGGPHGTGWTRHAEAGRVPGGRAYDRVRHVAPDGVTMLEQWTVHGAGHAWSGGNVAGSYTDPQGPDATGEMLRFFLEHPRRG